MQIFCDARMLGETASRRRILVGTPGRLFGGA
jgi:hypothetical protein